MEFIKHFNGYSGCNILLYKNDQEDFFVRKISKSQEYNFRLAKQKEKQQLFHSESFRVPQIYHHGLTPEGLYFFDMEFIIGMPLYQAICTPSWDISHDFIISLNVHFSSQNFILKDCTTAFIKKIEEIEIHENYQKFSGLYPILLESMKLLKANSWQNFPISTCHGDLTLENIIVTSDKKFYLIDFLDSFVDSLLIDCAKLLQDFELLWSFRNTSANRTLNVDFLLLKSQFLKAHFLLHRRNPSRELYQLLLLNCLRIIPYIQDREVDFIINAITHTMNILQGLTDEK